MFKELKEYTRSEDHPHLVFELKFGATTYSFQPDRQYGNDTGFSLWIPAKGLGSAFLNFLQSSGFKAETCFYKEYRVIRRDTGAPRDGVAFLDAIAAQLRCPA